MAVGHDNECSNDLAIVHYFICELLLNYIYAYVTTMMSCLTNCDIYTMNLPVSR